MNKVQVIKELYRDLSKVDVETARKALAKSGWKERRFSVQVTNGIFYGHLHVFKDDVKFYLCFSDEGLRSIQED